MNPDSPRWKPSRPERTSAVLKFLDQIPYLPLVVLTVFMLLAPFRPMPHVLEKLIMLKNGALNRPVDIFDLFYHLLPTC